MKVKNNLAYLFYIALALCISVQGAFAFERGEWKVLIYMQADNNLAPYALWDLAEIEKGLVGIDSVEVFVELDLPGDEGSFRLQVLENSTEKPQELSYFEKAHLSEFNIDILKITNEEVKQKEKLQDFILWAQANKPTEKTMVIVWGHGEGWNAYRLAQFGGIALDDSPVSRLGIDDIVDVLESSEDIYNSKIDFLSMDACLMQTAEIALEFSEVTKYISGSTQIQNFRGLPYTELIQSLKNSTSYELAQSLSAMHIVGTRDFLNEKDQKMATISVVNPGELKQVFAAEFNRAIKMLNEYMKEEPIAKLALINSLQKTPSFLGNSRDLSNFIGEIQKFLLKNERYKIYDQFDEALQALKQSIISYGYGDDYLRANGYYLGYFRAFGIWFPGNDMDFKNRAKSFEKSTFYQMVPAWSDLIHSLFRPIKPIFSFN